MPNTTLLSSTISRFSCGAGHLERAGVGRHAGEAHDAVRADGVDGVEDDLGHGRRLDEEVDAADARTPRSWSVSSSPFTYSAPHVLDELRLGAVAGDAVDGPHVPARASAAGTSPSARSGRRR